MVAVKSFQIRLQVALCFVICTIQDSGGFMIKKFISFATVVAGGLLFLRDFGLREWY